MIWLACANVRPQYGFVLSTTSSPNVLFYLRFVFCIHKRWIERAFFFLAGITWQWKSFTSCITSVRAIGCLPWRILNIDRSTHLLYFSLCSYLLQNIYYTSVLPPKATDKRRDTRILHFLLIQAPFLSICIIFFTVISFRAILSDNGTLRKIRGVHISQPRSSFCIISWS